MKAKKGISTFLVIAYILSFLLPTHIVKAATEYVSVTKTVNVTQMTNEEEAEVTLSIKGTPPVNVVKPNDVVLVIDKSGSMGTEKMEAAKSAAKSFIDLMDLTKHQVGLVDFSSTASETPLTTDANIVKNRISSLTAGGGTETGVAIRSAINVLSSHRQEAQPVIVILTDGEANNTPDALAAAQQAKELGIVFYTIALLNTGDNPDTNQWNTLLKNMATTQQHHHYVLGAQGLDVIYKAIVQEIGLASAYNVVVKDTIAPNFELVPGSADGNIPKPTINGNELTWNFLELKQDTLNFTYKIRHKSGQPMGTIAVGSSTTVAYNDYAGAKREFQVTSPSVTVKYPAPSITSIEADNGEIAGGNEVIIKGNKFRQGATVAFGSKMASNVTVVSPNEIRATVPAGTVGTVNVKVTNDDSQYATTTYRYWANPIVTKITPNNGSLEGGNIVTIEGNYFASGIKVYFGNVEASATYKNPMLVYAYAPQGVTAGTVDITLTNTDGTTVTMPGAYTYNANPVPEIISLTPNTGDVKGGNVVTITGKNLDKIQNVMFGTNNATNITVVNSTTITATVPTVATAGTVDVQAVNIDGQVSTLSSAYTYTVPVINPPKITALSQTEGQLIGGDTVIVTGTDFQQGIKAKLGGIDAPIVTYYSATSIKIRIPAASIAGPVDLQLENPDGQIGTMANAYTYLAPAPKPAPTITSLSLVEGPLAGGETIFVYGTNLQQGVVANLGGVKADVVTYYSATQIKIRIPASLTAGPVDLQLENPDGQIGTMANAYTYLAPAPKPAPTITSLSETEGLTTGGNNIFVNGTGFQQGLTVKLGGLDATVVTYYNETQIKIRVPSTTIAGTVGIELTNPDGLSASLQNAFTYKFQTPIITSLSKTEGLLSGGETVLVTGSGFESGITAKLGGLDATVVTYYGATQIKIMIPAGTAYGAVDLELTNPGGQVGVKTGAYTYVAPAPKPAPTITTLGTTEGAMSGGNTVIVNGTGFQAGITAKLGGIDAPIVTYYSATQIKIRIPATTVAGPADLVLTNPDGQVGVKVGAYKYWAPVPKPAPTITSLSSVKGSISGGVTVFVYGTGFQSGLTAQLGGQNAPLVTYYSATQIKIRIPATTVAGPADLIITNPDGQSVTLTSAYTYTSP